MTLTFGSLFSGIGGFDLGFERAKMRCAWQVEIDDKCRNVLAHHWPDVKRYGDVRDVGKRNLAPVDVITGGFPCQDVSVAGRREGLAGERSGLWFEFLRVIEELKPEWVIVENVPGLLSSNSGRDMGTIVGGLAECGYWWAYRCVDAQFFGVPQRRRRVFIIASLTKGNAQEVLFERESSPWDIAPCREAGQRVARNAQAGFSTSGRGWWREGIGPLTERQWRDAENGLVARPLAFGSTVNHYDESQQTYVIAQNGSDIQVCEKPGALTAGQARQTSGDLVAFDWQSGGDVRLNVSDKHTSALQANQVPAVAMVAPCLGKESYSPSKSSSGQMVDFCIGSQYGVRRLTPTECERLQGFPDGWTVGQSDTARYRQLGNAVCVPVAEWIGRRIVECDGRGKQ